MELSVPSINGLYHDHTSVRVKIPGLPSQLITSHLKSINFGESFVKRQYIAYGSCVISKEGFKQLIASSPQGYGNILFNFTISYTNCDGYNSSEVKLVESRIMSAKDILSNGGWNPDDVDLNLHIRYILRDGTCLAPNVFRL